MHDELPREFKGGSYFFEVRQCREGELFKGPEELLKEIRYVLLL